jgi:glycosyltransferase involved in cell wall biosynthesis
MFTTNLISIIVPLYNAEKYITRALESVYAQTYFNYEIIVIDDGSTDEGPAICARFASRKGKLRLFSQKNQGPGTARNVGLRKACGEFFLFLDADDYLVENALEIMRYWLQKTDTDMVIAEEIVVSENGECNPAPHKQMPLELIQEEPDYYFVERKNLLAMLARFRKHRNSARKIFYPCKGRLYKNQLIDENRITFPDNAYFMEDLIFQMRYCAQAKSVVFLKNPYYYYQLHGYADSITSLFDTEKFLQAAQLQWRITTQILTGNNVCSLKEAERAAAYAIIDDMLVNAVRSYQFITSDNYSWYYQNMKKLVDAPIVRRAIHNYEPLPGHSKLFPFLIKIKAIRWLLLIFKKKGIQRYQSSNDKES